MGDSTIIVLAVGRYDRASYTDMCLTARALGATEMILAGRRDPRLIRYLGDLQRKWGGKFTVSFVKDYRKVIEGSAKYRKVYLTRYGMPLNKLSYTLNTYKNIMLIVSSTDASSSLHEVADFNVSITDQPHCSAAAIAVFLHSFYRGRELAMHFENAKYKVVPREHGVRIEKLARR